MDSFCPKTRLQHAQLGDQWDQLSRPLLPDWVGVRAAFARQKRPIIKDFDARGACRRSQELLRFGLFVEQLAGRDTFSVFPDVVSLGFCPHLLVDDLLTEIR